MNMSTNANIQIRILVADDDADMRDFLVQALSEEGYSTLCAKDGNEALELLKAGNFDIVLTDLKMPGATGMDVLRSAQANSLHQPTILMTAFGTIDSAVESMKRGAYSYITKPFDLDDLLHLLRELAEQIVPQIEIENTTLRDGDESSFPIIYRSQAFKSLMAKVHTVSDSTASVLLMSETGTGKELIAKEIHRCSKRSHGAFVPVSVNMISDSLLESELFGHRKGSFTGADRDKPGLVEHADGGTLFLDEIGEMNPTVQAKLLRFLQDHSFRRVGDTQERRVDVRVITATNRDLRDMVTKGEFREDLFYRLAVITLVIPPLRDRRADIPALAYHFLRKYNRNYNATGFRPEIIDMLTDYAWPGNVRQLEGAIEHAVILRKSGLIHKRDLPEWFLRATDGNIGDSRKLETVEREHILQLLQECDGNRSRTARILGINRRTLTRKLQSYGIQDENGLDEHESD